MRTHIFELGIDWDGQRERYFFIAFRRSSPPQGSPGNSSTQFVTAIRWWSLDELEAAEELFAPRRLPALVRSLLEDGPPPEPVDVGV